MVLYQNPLHRRKTGFQAPVAPVAALPDKYLLFAHDCKSFFALSVMNWRSARVSHVETNVKATELPVCGRIRTYTCHGGNARDSIWFSDACILCCTDGMQFLTTCMNSTKSTLRHNWFANQHVFLRLWVVVKLGPEQSLVRYSFVALICKKKFGFMETSIW